MEHVPGVMYFKTVYDIYLVGNELNL